MYISIDTYFKANPDDSLDDYNVHRLMLTSLLLSHKFIDDRFIDSKSFANIGGMKIGGI